MAALSTDRNTPARSGADYSHPVKADTVVYAGSLVVLDAGYAAPGKTATGLVAAGRADEHADNSGGANGDVAVKVRKGVFRFENSADTDEIARSDIGSDCYIVDDQTVAKTDATSTRSKAGVIDDVDDAGVWVRIG